MDKETIINTLGPELYARESATAHEHAPSTGQSFTQPAVNYDFFFAVNNLIWKDSAGEAGPREHGAGLRYLPRSPDLHAAHGAIARVRGALQGGPGGLLETYAHPPGRRKRGAGPAAYTLWCDYFEHPDRVERAWRELLVEPNDRLLRRVREVSGPVPFPLKAALYQQLLPDKRWHTDILVSLYFSCVDSFGQVDKKVTRELLGQLEVDGEDERVQQIQDFLSK